MAIAAAVYDVFPGAPVAPGASEESIFEITFTGATDYLTNGVDVRPAILASTSWNAVEMWACVGLGPSLSAGIFAYSNDRANGKVKLYTSAAAECANALNISTIKLYVFAKGR
jgi:hypothetical protein